MPDGPGVARTSTSAARAFNTPAITEPIRGVAPNSGNTPLNRSAIPFSTLVVMSAACATAAANIYYNQPLLSDFARYFHTSIARAGMVATAAQVGYGVGLLFLVPLGDVMDRRNVVLCLTYTCVVLLAITAHAPSLGSLIVLQGLIGIAAVSTQLLIPLAVDLSPETERGRTIGVLMTGVLCGLLLARTVGGFVGDHLGWRSMFRIASASMLLTGVVLQFTLPRHPPGVHLSYRSLLRSLWGLFRSQPVIRNTSLASATSFGAFCAFWAVLSFFLEESLHLGASVAGLFGLVGLAGALCAPAAGNLSDRRGPAFALSLSMVVSMVSFASMLVWHSIIGLILGVLLLDLGAQATQVAGQTEVMATMPSARNRLNTIYMVSRYAGGALGSSLAVLAYARYGWHGSCAVCLVLLSCGLVLHQRSTRRAASIRTSN